MTTLTGKQLKFRGMDLAAEKRRADLEEARAHLVLVAQGRHSREVSADDVTQWNMGNSAGSLFRGEEWEWTGRFRESLADSRHRGIIRVWRLK